LRSLHKTGPPLPVLAHRFGLALTFDHSGADGVRAESELPAGQGLREQMIWFRKLDESVVWWRARGWMIGEQGLR
jgi:hypothetical protein